MSLPNCPQCQCDYTYESGALLMCPECGHEWSPTIVKEEVAQDDVLPGDFDGVKAAAAHFCFKQVAPDLAIDGAHGSSDHAAALHGLGREDRIDPGDVFAKGRWGGALWKGGGVIGMLHGQRHLRSK
mgnify:CR=1 FL=1